MYADDYKYIQRLPMASLEGPSPYTLLKLIIRRVDFGGYVNHNNLPFPR